jgi:membrane fusion protein, multidrug efflux system
MKISHSSLLAIGLSAAVLLWMASGLLTPANTSEQFQSAFSSQQRPQLSVRVLESQAKLVERKLQISARTEPNRRVEISAETDGRIVAVEAERGAALKQGQSIVVIDMRDRQARAAEAEALVRQRELEYQAAERLRGREFLSESQIAEAYAQLQSAQAALERIRQEISRTSIKAPFDGFLEERRVELGHFVAIGDPIAAVVDSDPLIVVGDVSERDIGIISIGSSGEARIRSGENIKGNIRYVAPVAAESTRTFRIELSVANPNGNLRAGMSAEIILSAGEVSAHQISPALLTLDDAGNIGVKIVDAQQRVVFVPVEVVVSAPDGIWVTGLPARSTLIAIGQGYVSPGEVVITLPMDATH